MFIREAGPADLAMILEVMSTAPWDKTGYLTGALARGDVLVTERDACIVAYAVWNREFFAQPFVWLVTVRPQYRRRGFASALIAHIEERCKGQRIYTSTNRSNAAMQRLLEKRGYRPCGEMDLDPGDPEIFYRLEKMGDDGIEPPTITV